MRSKLSPLLANQFLNVMENTILKIYEENNDLSFYRRYVDDIFCVIKKGKTETLLAEMNNFNPNLEFASEKMVNDKINFLDTTIFLKNGTHII